MKKHITLFLSSIYSAFNRTPFRCFFILILTVIHFHTSPAVGDDEPSSHELYEGFSVTVNFKKTLNKVQDSIDTLIASKKINEDTKYELKTLWIDLEEEILSKRLTVSQVIDLLTERAADKAIHSDKRKAITYVLRNLLKIHSLHDTVKIIQSLKEIVSAKKTDAQLRINAIHIIGDLFIKYSLPSEVSGILVLFQKEFLLENTVSNVQLALVQSIGRILTKYKLPQPEVIQVLNQIKTGLFNRNPAVRESTYQTVEWLLTTDKVPEHEKSKFISWLAGHLDDEDRQNTVLAIKALARFIERDILSDPNHIQGIAGTTAKLLIHTHHWIVQQKALKALHIILNKQPTALSSDYKEKIARKLPTWLMSQNLDTGIEAIKFSEILLNQTDLPHPEQLNILYTIAQLTFDESGTVRRVSSRIIRNLMADNNFSLPEKTEIASIVSKGFRNASHGIKRSLNILKAAETVGVVIDFDMLYNVAHTIHLPSPYGTRPEAFVRRRSDTIPLSNAEKGAEKKMLLMLKIEEQINQRSSEPSNRDSTCEENYRSPEIEAAIQE